jgi:hypothetical protein
VLLLLLVLVFLPLEASARKSAADEEPEAESFLYYFPMMYRDSTIAPDLVVEAITVNRDSAVVVIKNQGTTEVEVDNEFWVDLYVDPSKPPKKPNDVWDRVSTQGIAWGVWSKGLPLAAGETLTLTYCPEQAEPDPYYVDDYSKFDLPLAPGTPIFVQVDSASVVYDYGEVYEGHEILDAPYNNISDTLSIDGFGCGEAPEAPPIGLLPLVQSDKLPPRPHHTE